MSLLSSLLQFKNLSIHLLFFCPAFAVQEEAGMAVVPVIRRIGSYGVVTVSYVTQPLTAIPGVDYVPASGILQLTSGQEKAVINITIIDDTLREFEEQFSVALSNPTGQCSLHVMQVDCFLLLSKFLSDS